MSKAITVKLTDQEVIKPGGSNRFFASRHAGGIRDGAIRRAGELLLQFDGRGGDTAKKEGARLSAPTQREAAQRIKLRLRRSAEDIIEIGRDLNAVKASIGHGNFLPWVEAEFGMSRQTADRFRQVADVYGGKMLTVGNLDTSALYELAAPKTPLEVREEIEKMIEARAKIRLADEYDAAQERGEVKSNGGARNFTIPDQNSELPSAADIGLSRKDIHEARQVRDAETADPGIVRRVFAGEAA